MINAAQFGKFEKYLCHKLVKTKLMQPFSVLLNINE